MPSAWNIHYDRWVIDDGEPEREIGEQFEWFVLAFGSKDRLARVAQPTQSTIETPDYSYNVAAKVVYVSATRAVIDFGLSAVGSSDLLPTGTHVGEYVAGEIKLIFQHWTDPLPDDTYASMAHEWYVEAMWADLTPYRSGDGSGRWLIRDEQRVQYEQITSTREKNAKAYVLRCALAIPGTASDESGRPH
jgi:hypothetical protein